MAGLRAAVWSLMVALPLAAASPKGTVQGFVRDDRWKPVSGAIVVVGQPLGGGAIPIYANNNYPLIRNQSENSLPPWFPACIVTPGRGAGIGSGPAWIQNIPLASACPAGPQTVENLHRTKTDQSGFYRLRIPEMPYQMVVYRTAKGHVKDAVALAYGQVEIHAGGTQTRNFVLGEPMARAAPDYPPGRALIFTRAELMSESIPQPTIFAGSVAAGASVCLDAKNPTSSATLDLNAFFRPAMRPSRVLWSIDGREAVASVEGAETVYSARLTVSDQDFTTGDHVIKITFLDRAANVGVFGEVRSSRFGPIPSALALCQGK